MSYTTKLIYKIISNLLSFLLCRYEDQISPMYEAWEYIGIFEVILYPIYLALSVVPGWYLLRNTSFKWFYVHFVTLSVLKIIGSSLLIHFISSENRGHYKKNVFIGFLIFDWVSIGMFIIMLISVIRNLSKKIEPISEKKRDCWFVKRLKRLWNTNEYAELGSWDSLLEMVSVVGIILSIFGSLEVSIDANFAKALLVASAIVYMLVILVIGFILCIRIKKYIDILNLEDACVKWLVWMCVGANILLFIRILYALCFSASLGDRDNYYENTGRFTLFYGSWACYFFMAVVEELIITAIFTVATFLIREDSFKEKLRASTL